MTTRNREAEALFEQASALQREGHLLEAVDLYDRALRHDAMFVEAHLNLATALQRLGELTRARTHDESALTLAPDSATAHANLGTVLLELGELEEARRHLQRACELAPRNGSFHRYLIEARTGPVEEAHLRQMETLVSELDPSAITDRYELHFALGKAYADRRDFERSFEHLCAGNALKRATLEYDEAETLRALEALAAMLGKPLIEALEGLGDPSARPLFILGMPRSGTTLVEQILATYAEVHAAGELRFFERALQEFEPIGVDPKNVSAFTASLVEQFRNLGARYVRAIAEISATAPLVTDKNPLNFRFTGFIRLALPSARIIHVRRDPLDTALSCFSALFTEEVPFAYDLTELGRYYAAYERLMAHWAQVLGPGAILEIRYEALVDDFDRETQRIAEYCGLPWSTACRDFASVRRPIRTGSLVAVRQPLYRGAVGRAESYRRELEPFLEARRSRVSGMQR